MPPALRTALIACAVAAVVAGLFGFLGGATGAQLPGVTWLVPIVLGVTVAGAVGRLSGNRGENRLTGAERAAAAALTPPPGGALLVVTREGFAGKALGIDVAVDGRPAAQLRSPRAVVLPVAPGAHDVAAVIPNAEAGAAGAPLRVEVAPGEVAFVTVRFVMGMTRNSAAVERAADPARLRAALASMPLVAPAPEWRGGAPARA